MSGKEGRKERRIIEKKKGSIFSDVSASVKLGWLMFMWNFHGHFGLYANVKLNSMLGGSDWLGFFFLQISNYL